MADFAYAVFTEICTYLLDEDGACQWVLTPTGAPQVAAEAAIGAHFVACLDTRVAGGLVGELTVGASALFVATSQQTGRPILLRTRPITKIQHRDDRTAAPTQRATAEAQRPAGPHRPPPPPVPTRKRMDTPAPARRTSPEIEDGDVTLIEYGDGPLRAALVATTTARSDTASAVSLRTKKRR
jgi:hypothetical protein